MIGLAPAASLWAAIAAEPARYDPISADIEADVAIIGGGILGLSAALSVAEAGCSVVVLEAGRIGLGASGRNGGLVVPSLPRVGPAEVLSAMGDEIGAAFLRTVLGAPDEVFAIIRRFAIDCAPVQKGWLNPAHGPGLVPVLARRLAAWQSFGSRAALLTAAETRARIGSPHFHGALADPSGGHLNPLAYTRGLARAACQAGAIVHESSTVERITKQGERWRLTSKTGSLTASRILQASNAQPPGLAGGNAPARATVPLTVYQLATPVLPPALRASILPGGESMSDTRHNLFACCIESSGRLVTGGMAPLTQLGAGRWLPGLLAARLGRIFPQFQVAGMEVRFGYVWSGRAALTGDFLPRLFEIAPGWIAPITCNGRGVALSTALGRRIGSWLASGNGAPPLPVTQPTPFRYHALAARVPQLLLPLGMIADARHAR